MTDLTGKSIGRYQILEQIGQGGMATVYKAIDTRLESDVAVKFIRTDAFPPAVFGRVLKRFEREAKSLARLNHPNIIRVIDYGEHEGAPYLVMAYMPGGTLKQTLAGRRLSPQRAAENLLPIARALAYAHSCGILHRDVKPSNILITESGEPMLTDFGIAKLLEGVEGQTLTATGVGVGTPEYMAPEQGLGKAVDGRADVYSLGVVLYEMLTGQKPYTADTPMELVLKQMTEPLPPMRRYVPGIPPEVEQGLIKALARDASDRYADMGNFITALEAMVKSTMPEFSPGEAKPEGPFKKPAARAAKPTAGRDIHETRDDNFATPPGLAGQKAPEKKKLPGRPSWTIFALLGIAAIGLVYAWLSGFLRTPAVEVTRQPSLESQAAEEVSQAIETEPTVEPTPAAVSSAVPSVIPDNRVCVHTMQEDETVISVMNSGFKRSFLVDNFYFQFCEFKYLYCLNPEKKIEDLQENVSGYHLIINNVDQDTCESVANSHWVPVR